MTLIDFLFVWTLRSAVLVLLVAIPAFLWKRASASRRHALWLSALVGMVLLPFLTNLPKWRLPSEPVDSAAVTPMIVASGNGVTVSSTCRDAGSTDRGPAVDLARCLSVGVEPWFPLSTHSLGAWPMDVAPLAGWG